MNSKLIKATASTFVLGATLTACAPSANLFRPASASANATSSDRQAAQAYERAQRAMLKGDPNRAITEMESAAELSPQDAGFRKTLAELYLKTGRFVSAETTYSDVVRLNPGDSKAAFFIAICQMAQGHTAAALAQLGSMDNSVDAADLGLAYALVGNTRRAIYLLEPAARSVTANGRVRQNLALAYALAGDWKNARVIAQQDVSPADLNKRMQQWAMLASTPAVEARVAILFGVSPVADPGQPSRLAWTPAPAPADATAQVTQPAATAAAEVPATVFAAAEPVATPPAVAALTPVAPIAAPAPVLAASPEVTVQPVAAAVPGFASTAQPAPVTGPMIPARRAALPVARTQLRKPASSRFVVQIGAYNAPDQVEKGFAQLLHRHAVIGKYEPVSTSVRIEGKGLFYRLSLAGFESQTAAASICNAIKAQGGACFVRATAGDAPVQWASRYNRKV